MTASKGLNKQQPDVPTEITKCQVAKVTYSTKLIQDFVHRDPNDIKDALGLISRHIMHILNEFKKLKHSPLRLKLLCLYYLWF